MEMTYTIKSGKFAGVVCAPHKTKSGSYIVSKTRFKEDQIEVKTMEEVKQYLDRGFKVRVSGIREKTSPSLVNKDSLVISP